MMTSLKRFCCVLAIGGSIWTAFAAVELPGTVDWERTEEIAPGIRMTSFSLDKPRLMKGSIARVDLKTPGLRIHMPYRDPDWGKPMPDCPNSPWVIRTKRMTCRSIMTDFRAKGDNMVLIANASGWRPWERPFTQKYADKLSLVISDGVLVSEAKRGRQSFLFYADGTVKLIDTDENTDLTRVRQAISGYGFVVKEGVVCSSDNQKQLHPRTGFGLSADHRYFYIVVIDGRQKKYSMGATTYEVGQFLKYAGATDGLNMDGGGSTTLLSWDAKKQAIRKHNTHIGNLEKYIPGTERTVGGWMGFSINPVKK